jgi:hypothetical protein
LLVFAKAITDPWLPKNGSEFTTTPDSVFKTNIGKAAIILFSSTAIKYRLTEVANILSRNFLYFSEW